MAKHKSRPIPPLTSKTIARFLSKVDKRGPDECWPYRQIRKGHKYGSFRVTASYLQYTEFPAHQIAYFIEHRAQFAPLNILHRCDNPSCCNPRHLWPGTDLENIADRHRKGRDAKGPTSGHRTHPERTARGERNGNAKFTAEIVRDIRRRLRNGERQSSIGRLYNVWPSAIGHIKHGRSWVHVA